MSRFSSHKHVPSALLRMGSFEFTKTGVSRFDFSDPYRIALTLNWRQFALCLFLIEVTINVIFALLYMVNPGCVANARPGSFTDAFFFSLETLATVGYGVMAPVTLYGHIISALEILTGISFMAVITGLVFVRFSRARSRILFADHAVIAKRDGQPCLMIRIGNGHPTPMGNATVNLTAVSLKTEVDENHLFRAIHDLKLERSYMPFFPLTWTVMHVIDVTSPLYGLDASGLKASDFRIMLTMQAYDYAVGTTVNTMLGYSYDHILHNMRYQDAIVMGGNGHISADLTKLSLIEPDA